MCLKLVVLLNPIADTHAVLFRETALFWIVRAHYSFYGLWMEVTAKRKRYSKYCLKIVNCKNLLAYLSMKNYSDGTTTKEQSQYLLYYAISKFAPRQDVSAYLSNQSQLPYPVHCHWTDIKWQKNTTIEVHDPSSSWTVHEFHSYCGSESRGFISANHQRRFLVVYNTNNYKSMITWVGTFTFYFLERKFPALCYAMMPCVYMAQSNAYDLYLYRYY